MRLVYLNADRGIPLLASKGASVHVRASLASFAPYVEQLTALCARIEPKKPPVADASRIPARLLGPFGTGDGVEGALLANDDAAAYLSELHENGRMDTIYERLSLWSVAGAEAARRWNVPWFLEVNAPLAEEATAHRNLQGRDVAFFLQQSLLQRATGIVVVSEELRDWARNAGVEDERILVAPNGCDPGVVRPAPTREDDRPFTVAFVGTLKPWHGLEILVEAFESFHADHPASRLLIVGDGPMAGPVRERLEGSLPESAFEMTGALPHEQVADCLRRADVAVAPYPELPDFYFSPLKVLDYSAAGLPIVASRIGQIAQTWTDGKDALLVEPGQASAITSSLRRLVADADLRARLAVGSRALAERRSWSAVTGTIVDWMESRVGTCSAGAIR